MAIEKYVVLQGDVADSTDLDDFNQSGLAENDILIRNGSSQWVNSATLPAAAIAADSITYAKLQNMAGFSVLANPDTGAENPSDLTAGADAILGRVGSGDLAFQKLALSQMADMSGTSKLIGSGSAGNDTVELSLGTNLSISGTTLNATGGAGDYVEVNAVGATDGANFNNTVPAAVGSGVNVLFQRSGTSPDSVSAYLAAGAVSNAVLRDSTGFSVIGKTDTGTGSAADIVAGDETVLGRTGAGNLAFAQLMTGQITDANVTLAKIADAAANDKLLGSGDAGSGNPYAEITLGTNLSMSGTTLNATGGGATDLDSLTDVTITTPATNSVLIKSAGDWIDGLIVTGSITDANVTLAKIANAAANDRLLGSGDAGSGNPYAEITLGASLTMTGTALSVTDPSSAGLSGYVMNASGVVVADHTDRVVNGSARGTNAVDLQTERSSADDVAGAANSVIGGGEDNELGVAATHGTIGGGYDNVVISAGSTYPTIAGGANNVIAQSAGTIPGGRQATTFRYGEHAYGGATLAAAQKVQNVATAKTADATLTTMGYTNALSDWSSPTIDTATIPFPGSSLATILSFEGTVVCMRGETSDTAGCFKISGAVKKNTSGTVAFVGNPKVSVVGRDNAALDCDVVLAAANGGVDIKVTGIAAQSYAWACEWEGIEIKMPTF